MKNPLIVEKLKKLNMNYYHPPHILEQKLFNAIKMGSMDESIQILKDLHTLDSPKLAKTSVRSKKNALIAACTVYTRAAIAGGVYEEDAFDLSDIFINYVETFDDEKALNDFQYRMVRDFVQLVQETSTPDYSYPILKVVKYILEHVPLKVSTSSLAEIVNLSPDYLSKLFHKEVGMTLSHFIQAQKVEVAKYYLELTDITITDIATLLEFCNASYFTSIFKKHTGLTPKQFRKTNNIYTHIKQ